mmetsp:Transcript_8175/g.23461  ORF Transcript_8175/g.23461 Transcript_8175/m.23461 type:complete len:306 (+) Transcript_8175:1396-2313(+)
MAAMSMAATAGDESSVAELSPMSSMSGLEMAAAAMATGLGPAAESELKVTQPAAPPDKQQATEDAGKPDAWTAALIQNFLDSTASQLTPSGISTMLETLRPNELAVFFRNNHFSTLFHHEGALYLLVTDVGFLHEADIMWERMESVQGSSTFFTPDLLPWVPHSEPTNRPSTAEQAVKLLQGAFGGGGAQTGSGQAAAVAASAPPQGGAAAAAGEGHSADTDQDYALALALQEEMAAEEERRQREQKVAAEEQARHQQLQQPEGRRTRPAAAGAQQQQPPLPQARRQQAAQQRRRPASRSDCVVM